MYQLIFRHLARKAFENLNQGNCEPILNSMASHFTHTFSGSHALGGTRHTVKGMRCWFERLFRLSPGLHFDIKDICVNGSPWNTVVAVEWVDHFTALDGQPYINEGVHMLRFLWGRIVEIHAYLDTQKVEVLMQRLAAVGIDEAVAPAIED